MSTGKRGRRNPRKRCVSPPSVEEENIYPVVVPSTGTILIGTIVLSIARSSCECKRTETHDRVENHSGFFIKKIKTIPGQVLFSH